MKQEPRVELYPTTERPPKSSAPYYDRRACIMACSSPGEFIVSITSWHGRYGLATVWFPGGETPQERIAVMDNVCLLCEVAREVV